MAASGLGSHDVDSLVRVLAGSTASVNASISQLSQGFQGQAAPRDLETMFQLIHLWVTEPRFDEDAFQRIQNLGRQRLQNREMSPDTPFLDRRNEMRFGGHYRTLPPTVEAFESVLLERTEAVYRDRFANMSDQHFFFVGNFDVEEMRPLVETWLASLPTTDREETWKDPGIRYAQGVQSDVVYAGTEPKARVSIDFTGDYQFSRELSYQMGAAAMALEQILLERLREDLGGTYSVSVGAERLRLDVLLEP